MKKEEMVATYAKNLGSVLFKIGSERNWREEFVNLNSDEKRIEFLNSIIEGKRDLLTKDEALQILETGRFIVENRNTTEELSGKLLFALAVTEFLFFKNYPSVNA